mgnify:CR=1 FL=1|jgi:putative ABC transport system ATP-binding protein
MTGGSQPRLQVRDLSKTFFTTDPPVEVLRGIDLDVAAGEYLAIMGASGSGKSTLLYAMSGMDHPTGGSVCLDGRELTELGEAEMSRVRLTRMGFVFQQSHFLRNLNIRDNVLLPALKAGNSAEQAAAAQQTVDRLLERFGIAEVAAHEVTQASGGQLQRASLCRALATDPAVLFADEPTGALNSSATQDALDALTEANRAGTTIVMVTHDPVCAARAERLVYLVDGRVVDTLRQGPWSAEAAARRERELLAWLGGQGF